ERLVAVALQAAVLLRLDDEHALARDALVARAEQPRLDRVGERGRADVEAQVDRVRHLVDVLPSRSLRADGRELDLALGNRDTLHGRYCARLAPAARLRYPRLEEKKTCSKNSPDRSFPRSGPCTPRSRPGPG